MEPGGDIFGPCPRSTVAAPHPLRSSEAPECEPVSHRSPRAPRAAGVHRVTSIGRTPDARSDPLRYRFPSECGGIGGDSHDSCSKSIDSCSESIKRRRWCNEGGHSGDPADCCADLWPHRGDDSGGAHITSGCIGLSCWRPLCGSNGVQTANVGIITCTYTTIGEDTFNVPPGVTTLDVTAVGADGTAGAPGGTGGDGASATGSVSVPNGIATLYAEVDTGGGAGGLASASGGGGGGSSDVRIHLRPPAD